MQVFDHGQQGVIDVCVGKESVEDLLIEDKILLEILNLRLQFLDLRTIMSIYRVVHRLVDYIACVEHRDWLLLGLNSVSRVLINGCCFNWKYSWSQLRCNIALVIGCRVGIVK